MWADRFVGLRGVGKRPCWNLVRSILDEQAGIELPSYEDDDPNGWTIEGRAADYKSVLISEARALDVAILMTDVRVGLIWKSVPAHIGIFTDAKNILHVEEGFCSRVQPAADLRIHSIVRVTG